MTHIPHDRHLRVYLISYPGYIGLTPCYNTARSRFDMQKTREYSPFVSARVVFGQESQGDARHVFLCPYNK